MEIENNEFSHITDYLISVRLTQHPNKHIIIKGLKNYNIQFEPEFFYIANFEVKFFKLEMLDDEQVFKAEARCNLICTKRPENENKEELKNILLKFYTVYSDSNNSEPLLLSLDDLLFYLNRRQNESTKQQNEFPELHPCYYKEGKFNFISAGTELRNKYFPTYSGTALDSDFECELIELYTIISNNLSFLYRYKERVFEEIAQYDNHNYQSSLFMYPRFNNTISETAGSIYNFWERIAFFINEIYPLNPNSNSAPSYWRYFDEIRKRADKNSILKNRSLDWFISRLYHSKEQERLNDLRHSLIHYNKSRNIKGTRSASFIENRPDKNETIQEWNSEILFLRKELDNLSTALEQVISLIEIWASNGVKI